MGIITLLPTEITNKIAAGEVVERPASIVKELVENALDANTQEITIDIEEGGIKKIRILDTGDGMDTADLKASVIRFATSKIHSFDDLQHVASFGFRGEALASVAAVAKVTIQTKQESESIGKQLIVEAGSIHEVTKSGMPKGTQILVEQLFDSIPARKKFLKSPQTEFRHIQEYVMSYALAYPDVAFTFIHNGKKIFQTPHKQSSVERTTTLLGEHFMHSLLPVQLDHPHIKISGFISKPQQNDTNQNYYLFVNTRPIKDKLIVSAVKNGYKSMLTQKSGVPFFVLFINVPPDFIDVNVHPRKEEIKFANSQTIFSLINQLIEKKLNSILTAGIAIENNVTFQPAATNTNVQNTYRFPQEQKQIINNYSRPNFTQQNSKILPETSSFISEIEIQNEQTIDSILQYKNLYLIFEFADQIYVVDQHAAHERILFEMFFAKFSQQQSLSNSQSLLIPQIISLTPTQRSLFMEYSQTFSDLGFIFTISHAQLEILSVPSQASTVNLEKLINDMLFDLEEKEVSGEIDSQNKRIIASLACRLSVMAGDPLPLPTQQHIVQTLFKTKNNLTCPHGRPTYTTWTKKQLDQIFKRI